MKLRVLNIRDNLNVLYISDVCTETPPAEMRMNNLERSNLF